MRKPPPRGPELFPYNMKWEGESPRTKEQESYRHTQVFLVPNDDSTSRLSPDQAKRI